METCPKETVFMDCLEGRLSPQDRLRLEEHLDTCSACATLMVELAQLAWPEQEDAAPTQLGPYQIRGTLGVGGTSTVLEAWDTQRQRPVALKKLSLGDLTPRQRQAHSARLHREARLLSRVDHPHVLPVYQLHSWRGELYMAMHLVQGCDMGSWLRAEPRLWTDVIDVFLQAGQGLAAAHRCGITHRDVKPENILLGDEGGVWLADFGLARLDAQAADLEGASALATLTRTGTILGTPAYMAPEQQVGGACDARSDQFSLCASLYLALYQQRPFAGDSPQEYALRVCAGELRPPPEGSPAPASLFPVLARGMALAPQDRWPDIDTLLGALRGASTRTHDTPQQAWQTNLKPWPDAFVGRQRRLQDLLALLKRGERLITLQGTAGTGKTRLAQELGLRTQDHQHHALCCDLTEARRHEDILEAVAAVLQVSPSGAEVAPQLGTSLSARGPLLLILDNAEQVSHELARLLPPWLERAPALRLLLTSRHRLGLAQEHILDLDPLALPPAEASLEEAERSEAVALFLERARQQRRGFGLTQESLEDVVALVRLLDGLPLALELAAARTRMLSPGRILARLRDKRAALRDQDRPDRHQTLQVALDWSWELLPPWEQAAWSQLSLFEGGFSPESAEAVLALDPWPQAPEPLEVLDALVGKSLLRAHSDGNGDPRLFLLLTLQAHGQEKLQQEGAILTPAGQSWSGPQALRSSQRRFVRHIARLGEPEALEALHTRSSQRPWITLQREYENLRAAARCTQDPSLLEPLWLALGNIFELRGPYQRGAHFLRESLEALEAPSPALRARVLERVTHCLRLAGLVEEARVHLEEALPLARAHGLRRLEGWLLGHQGALLSMNGDTRDALALYQQAVAIAQQTRDRRAEGVWLGQQGLVLRKQGQLDQALGCYQGALEIAHQIGDLRYQSIWSVNLGAISFHHQRYEEAQQHYLRSLELARQLGDQRQEIILNQYLAILHKHMGQLGEARGYFEQTLTQGRRVGLKEVQGFAQEGLSVIYMEQGRLAMARQAMQEALQHALAAGNQRQEMTSRINKTELDLLQGRLDEGARELERAERIICEMGLDYARPYLEMHQARLALLRQDPELACTLAQSALDRATRGEESNATTLCLALLGDIQRQLGRWEEADTNLRLAETRLRGSEATLSLAKTLCWRAQLEAQRGQRQQAALLLQEAQGMAQRMQTGARSTLGRLLEAARQSL